MRLLLTFPKILLAVIILSGCMEELVALADPQLCFLLNLETGMRAPKWLFISAVQLSWHSTPQVLIQ